MYLMPPIDFNNDQSYLRLHLHIKGTLMQILEYPYMFVFV